MRGKKTGGRRPGSRNRRTKELDEKAKKGGLLPLDYMLEVLRDTEQPALMRQDMAKAAAPYLHARRAPEDKAGNVAPAYYLHPALENDND